MEQKIIGLAATLTPEGATEPFSIGDCEEGMVFLTFIGKNQKMILMAVGDSSDSVHTLLLVFGDLDSCIWYYSTILFATVIACLCPFVEQ